MIKIRAIFITTRFTQIYARDGILFTCGKHLHNLIALVNGEVLAHITTLIPTYFIEVPVAIEEIQRPCICRTGTAYSSRASEFTPGSFLGGDSCYSIFSFIRMFYRSLFVLLFFFFWPLRCMFFVDMRILITPLVSSNSSYN